MTTPRQQLGAAVAAARKKQGLTQGELGHRVGVSMGTISNLETGRHETAPDTIRAVAAELGLELTEQARASEAALDFVLQHVRGRYDELDSTKRLVFVGQLLTWLAEWHNGGNGNGGAELAAGSPAPGAMVTTTLPHDAGQDARALD